METHDITQAIGAVLRQELDSSAQERVTAAILTAMRALAAADPVLDEVATAISGGLLFGMGVWERHCDRQRPGFTSPSAWPIIDPRAVPSAPESLALGLLT